MAAPTFVASYGPGTLATGATRTASVTTAVGDLLVLHAILANGGYTTNTPTGGTGLTWTLRQDTNTGLDANHGRTRTYTATATTAETFTLSVGGGPTAEPWAFQVQRWSNHGGYGGSTGTNAGGSAPSLAYTTTGANSALSLSVNDWNAIDGTTRTARTGAGAFTESLYLRNAATLTAYAGYHADAGTAAAKTVGYTAPTGQLPSMVVVEVLAPAAVTTLSGTGATQSITLTLGSGSGSISYPVFTSSSGAGDPVALTLTISAGTGSSVGAGPLPAMVAWRTALKNRATTPATVMWVGDSLTEGQGASARANRWQDKVLSQLRTDLPTPGVTGGYGYVPTWYAVFTPDSTWSTSHRTTSGTIADLQVNPGDTIDKTLGLRHTNLSAGATVSLTVTGTSADLWWLQGYGSFTYKVDAGSATTINTAGGTTGYPAKTTISLGTAGSHTVLITATTAVRVAGLMVYNGDESKGIRAVDAAHVGFFSDSYSGAGMQQAWQLVSPDLVLIELGVNDYIYSHQTSAQVKANIQALISEIRLAVSKQVSIAVAIINGSINSGGNAETYTAYRNAITAITTADPTVKLFDLGTITQTASDGAHPSDAGYTTLATTIRPLVTFDDRDGTAGALSIGLTVGTATGTASTSFTGTGASLTLTLTVGSGTGSITYPTANALIGGGAAQSLSLTLGSGTGAPAFFGAGEALLLALVAGDADATGVGLAVNVWLFHTPTQDVWFRIAGRGLVGSYTQGLSVFRVGGVWITRLSPTADDLAGADRFYQGGYAHVLDEAARAELIAAGFGANISLQEVS